MMFVGNEFKQTTRAILTLIILLELKMVLFTSRHLPGRGKSGVALDDIIITADLLPSTASPTTDPRYPEVTDGHFGMGMDTEEMKRIIILLLCAVAFLVLVIVVLVFILLRKKKKDEFTPVGLTVANSTYDLPSTISGINTSEDRYFKYGTYSGERYPPVSPASDISLPFTKVSKKKRKGLTLPLRTSQATGTFEFKGVSPMASPSPQSPDSASSKLYVQKRSKLGLLGRAQAMIYGSPKPMSKRLSRSLPDNLEWTLSGYARGPYQITDLINGRFELQEIPSPPSDASQYPSHTDRPPSVKSPQISLHSSNPPNQHFDSHTENNNLTDQCTVENQTQERVPSNQHNVINEHFKERTLDRSTLTLPLNVKRPSWDADKYEMIFDSGDEQCELLDLLQGSNNSKGTNIDEDYEPVLAKEHCAVSRNNNGRSSRGSSSPQTPTTPRLASRDEVYEMVSPVDRTNTTTDLCISSEPDGSPSIDEKGVTTCPAVGADGYEVARPSIKKKPHFKIEKRKVSFSAKTSIIERPPIDSEEYDEGDNEPTVGDNDPSEFNRSLHQNQTALPLVVRNSAKVTSNGGYVNVRRASENDGEALELDVNQENENPSEYEMISPTMDERQSLSRNGTEKDPNVYDELARDFPLRKNPRSIRSTSSNYNKIVMPDIVPSTETNERRRVARNDYYNIASPDDTLKSPEGGELSFYHFTPSSPRGSSSEEKETKSTGALGDDYEMVG
ncbi:hypothetical protein HOLleu_24359 [Holothuria leucospilota]|uniref:Uncharacterized protein n=1 Tax=Holothuria leucospilota TaxID=206669 RepID=A0A9Q1BVA9_HOLLE|nr:hypothetical protein HOLleu_24359 [Holothuria leucospilota]